MNATRSSPLALQRQQQQQQQFCTMEVGLDQRQNDSVAAAAAAVTAVGHSLTTNHGSPGLGGRTGSVASAAAAAAAVTPPSGTAMTTPPSTGTAPGASTAAAAGAATTPPGGTTGAASAIQITVTRMLLLVSTVFVILNLPFYLSRIYLHAYANTLPRDSFLYILQRYFMLLYYTNFSINFILYNVSSRMFRIAMCDYLYARWLSVKASLAAWGPSSFYSSSSVHLQQEAQFLNHRHVVALHHHHHHHHHHLHPTGGGGGGAGSGVGGGVGHPLRRNSRQMLAHGGGATGGGGGGGGASGREQIEVNI